MHQDELIALGDYCETLMNHHMFNVVVQCFDAKTTQSLLNTAPGDKETRERHYHEIQGVRGLLSMMVDLVKQKNDLIDQTQAPSDDDDYFDDEVEVEDAQDD